MSEGGRKENTHTLSEWVSEGRLVGKEVPKDEGRGRRGGGEKKGGRGKDGERKEKGGRERGSGKKERERGREREKTTL